MHSSTASLVLILTGAATVRQYRHTCANATTVHAKHGNSGDEDEARIPKSELLSSYLLFMVSAISLASIIVTLTLVALQHPQAVRAVAVRVCADAAASRRSPQGKLLLI